MTKHSGQRRPFTALGLRFRSFGRSLIRHYVAPKRESDAELPPSWQEETEEPLFWPSEATWDRPAADEVPPPQFLEEMPPTEDPYAPPSPRPRRAAPPVQPPPAVDPRPAAPAAPKVQRKNEPQQPMKDQPTDPRLAAILNAHRDREEQRDQIREQRRAELSMPPANIQPKAEAGQSDLLPPDLGTRRRRRASFDYVETTPLRGGEEAPPSAPAVQRETAEPPVENYLPDEDTGPIVPFVDPAPPVQRVQHSPENAPQPEFAAPEANFDDEPYFEDEIEDFGTGPIQPIQRAPEIAPGPPAEGPRTYEHIDDFMTQGYPPAPEADFDDEQPYFDDEIEDFGTGPIQPIQRTPEVTPTTPAEGPRTYEHIDDFMTQGYPPAPEADFDDEQPYFDDEIEDFGTGPIQPIQRAPEVTPTMPAERPHTYEPIDDFMTQGYPPAPEADFDDEQPYFDDEIKDFGAEQGEFVQRAFDHPAPPAPPQMADDLREADFSAEEAENFDTRPLYFQPTIKLPPPAPQVAFDPLSEDDFPPSASHDQHEAPVDIQPAAPRIVQRQEEIHWEDEALPETPIQTEAPPWQPPRTYDITHDLITEGYQSVAVPESAPETPAPPQAIQRTTQPEKSAPAAPENPRRGEQQPVDLYQALVQAGVVEPGDDDDLFEPAAYSQEAPPQNPAPIQRAPAQRGDMYEAVPDAGSDEADMLSLLDLPPDTPVVRQRPPAPDLISRVPEAPENPRQPLDLSEALMQEPIMRAESAPTTSAANAPASTESAQEAPSEDGGEEVDIDKLARDVYSRLRNRLRIERERNEK